MAPTPGPRRASIIGTGLVGGSIGLALRAQGWTVTGSDRDPAAAARALELGAIDAIGLDPDSEVTVVAVPVRGVVEEVRRALEIVLVESADEVLAAALPGAGDAEARARRAAQPALPSRLPA